MIAIVQQAEVEQAEVVQRVDLNRARRRILERSSLSAQQAALDAGDVAASDDDERAQAVDHGLAMASFRSFVIALLGHWQRMISYLESPGEAGAVPRPFNLRDAHRVAVENLTTAEAMLAAASRSKFMRPTVERFAPDLLPQFDDVCPRVQAALQRLVDEGSGLLDEVCDLLDVAELRD